MKEKYLELIRLAIKRFYDEDATEMFGDASSKSVSEWAMAGCIYRYLWDKLKEFDGMPSAVDIEYNRLTSLEQGDSRKRINKCNSKSDCPKYEECMKVLEANIDKAEREENKGLFRPDIIIHNRREAGKDNNGLVIEVKKEECKKEYALFDCAKLSYLVCDKSGELQYQFGAMILLRKNCAYVGFFEKDQDVIGYAFKEGEWRHMTDQEQRDKVWCKP